MGAKSTSAPDWERIELEYRTGVKSVRELAAAYGVSHTAINKRAKTQKWERDLSAKIKAKAEAKVSKAQVSREVSVETQVRESEIVEANAQAIADVRLAHRADIRRGRSLVLKLLAELEQQTDNADLFDDLGELMRKPDDNGQDKLNDLYRKVISLSGRVSNVKALAEALKNLVGLEREAWSLDEKEKPPEDARELSDEDLQRRIEAMNERLGYQRAG